MTSLEVQWRQVASLLRDAGPAETPVPAGPVTIDLQEFYTGAIRCDCGAYKQPFDICGWCKR